MFYPDDVNPDFLSTQEQNAVGAELLLEMEKVAWATGALDLRLARLLAWFKTQDVSALGFQSYTAWLEEKVGWKSTWLRKMVRFAEADLPVVREAVCQGALPISVALRSLHEVGDEVNEERWLADVLANRQKRFPRPPPEDEHRVDWVDEEAKVIDSARDLARLLMGRPATNVEADKFVRTAYEEQLSSEELVARAKETPPAPEQKPVPEWVGDDLATALAGPWKTPEDLSEALQILENIQEIRQERVVRLGLLYKAIRENRWVLLMGFSSHAELARHLGMSLRSLQRYALLVDAFSMYPEMDAAYREGMDLTRLEVISTIAEEDTAGRWVEVAGRVPVAELRRAVQWAVAKGADEVLTKYEAAYSEATHGVALQEAKEEHERPRVAFAPADQLKAARWFIETVYIPLRSGFQKTVERDNYQCQNPRCQARNLRVQAHHVHWVSLGGNNSPENGIALCVSCHLRMVHANKASVTRVGNRLEWEYADGEKVTVFEK